MRRGGGLGIASCGRAPLPAPQDSARIVKEALCSVPPRRVARRPEGGGGEDVAAAAGESDSGGSEAPTSFELPDGTKIEAGAVASVPDALFESAVDVVSARARGGAGARTVA